MRIRYKLGGAIIAVLPAFFLNAICSYIWPTYRSFFDIAYFIILLMGICFSRKIYFYVFYNSNSTCALYAGNQALRFGYSPKAQDGTVWNPNDYKVSQIYDMYPDGREVFDRRWWKRNGDELIGLLFDGIEIYVGFQGLGATGGISKWMTRQGVSNASWKVLKILWTSVVDQLEGSDKADYVDSLFAMSAIGGVIYCIGWLATKYSGSNYKTDAFKKMCGQLGDCLDLALAWGLSWSMSGNIKAEIAKLPPEARSFLQRVYTANESFLVTRLGEELYEKITSGLLIKETAESVNFYDQ